MGIPATYEAAMNLDSNVIFEKEYEEASKNQLRQFVKYKDTIAALARHHVGADSETCVTLHLKSCKMGQFNLCVPLTVERPDAPPIKLFFRSAMPHKLGELRSAGAVDEKMRCEAATYAWMQEKCPDIRIPYLYGFGLTDHTHFTHQSQRPLLTRVVQYLRRLFHTWMWPSTILSHYVPHPSPHSFFTAYMVLEDVSADGSRMLWDTWKTKDNDVRRRQNFFRDYTKIIVSLARVPQPRIGSFRFHSNGTITLSNRPLTTTMAVLENEGTPRCIPRDRTYTNTDSYVSDMLSFHAGRLSTHPNAAVDSEDLRVNMASLVAFRAVAHDYIHPDRREGPFFLQFDDLHVANIFVDDDWNIRSLVDLEWVNALPLEMMQAPYWLVRGDLADFSGEQLDRFKERRLEYMEIFESEERKAAPTGEAILTDAITWSWNKRGSWFWLGITTLNAMSSMFQDHISYEYDFPYKLLAMQTLSQLWSADSSEFVQRREKDFAAYRQEVRNLYRREMAKNQEPNGGKDSDETTKCGQTTTAEVNTDETIDEKASHEEAKSCEAGTVDASVKDV
ncbi:hypothetical protein E4U43_007985 [Claviceps pusilla]|uniref:Aminoglycoside phosphotransferase domain-containing protein n=1 Tax=Claviceps pusilla TaxID=123648 RepID=A0A9P7NC39_9HYPO|nr:hypothetical protein E4U43_007985 [Claviceps pusilla]